MSILFCTPMYGGFCQAEYFTSCMNLKDELHKAGVAHDFLIGTNESLITRARNQMVKTFLTETEFQFLMFIDGDIEFQPDDVAKLWNLERKVSCGAYSRKAEGEVPKVWVQGSEFPLSELGEPTAVDYAGTGFILIHRSVFESLIKAHPETGHDERGRCHAIFDTQVLDDTYLSEDYTFCQRWRALGGEIVCDPSVSLKHWGRMAY